MLQIRIEDMRSYLCLGRLFLIRHGSCPGNLQGRYLGGSSDESLDLEQMLTIKELGHRHHIWRKQKGSSPRLLPDAEKLLTVFISPMMRCRETAGILYPKVRKFVIPEWREIDFGEFEGKNYQDLQYNSNYQAWIDGGGRGDFPGGERQKDYRLRVQKGFVDLVDEMRSWLPNQTGIRLQNTTENTLRKLPQALAVVHGGTIMTILSSYGGGNYFDYQVKNLQGYSCLLMLDEGQNIHIAEICPIAQAEEDL